MSPGDAATLRSATLQRDGAQLFPAAIDRDDLAALITILSEQPQDRAGVRLHGVEGLWRFLDVQSLFGRIASSVLTGTPKAVRAIYFDKTASMNWSLAWHQDRVIAVRERIETDGFGPWTRKQGAHHVAPPYGLLARMLTLRLHLDPTPLTNAPLLVALGSHSAGRIAERDIPAVVARSEVMTCLAAAGDAWLYATPILHASEAATVASRRRVLQVDFADFDLPNGLEWLGI